MLRLLGNLSWTGTYAYTREQVEQIFTALQSELIKDELRFLQEQESFKKRLLELCRKLSSGELRYIMQQMKQNGDNKPIQEWLGGTSAEKLRQYGKARQDGKSLSSVCKLLAGQKTDFLLIADSGPGDKDAKGLIVPRFGNKPENHVVVSMTFESLSELLLMTKTHYEAWLTAWYLSQRQSTHQQNLMPANRHAAAQDSFQSGVPEYSGTKMF